jgi:hypothetical protein
MKKLLLIAFAVCIAAPAYGLQINEWVSNDISTDDHEFIELLGNPGEDLTGYCLVLIEGEGSSAGLIDRIIVLDGYSINAAGYFVVGDPLVNPDLEMSPGWIENGGNNIILLRGLEEDVTTGLDIDVDNDCVEDRTIGVIIDAVGYGYGFEAADCITYYGAVPVGPDGNYDPAGGAVCFGAWEMICLDGTEPTGPGCTLPDYSVGYATPGGPNDCFDPTATDNSSWGGVKALYR